MASPSSAPAAKPAPWAPLRLGLCCQFVDQPIKFRTTTVTACLRMERAARLAKLSDLCLANAAALLASLEFCASAGVGCFRVNSQVLPVKTHREAGYAIDDLPAAEAIVAAFRRCGAYAALHDVRLSLHPDQFVVLSSPREEVVASSLAELDYHAEVAEWIGADVLNIHGGGAYGSKGDALERFARNLDRLGPRARARLTLENDDKTYHVADLLPLCRREGLPLVYDVHHHRVLPDGLTVPEATDAAAETWDREPMVHLSSPKEGWLGAAPHRHHDDIDVADFPEHWWGRSLTIEVEAKSKERALAKLQADLTTRFAPPPPRKRRR